MHTLLCKAGAQEKAKTLAPGVDGWDIPGYVLPHADTRQTYTPQARIVD